VAEGWVVSRLRWGEGVGAEREGSRREGEGGDRGAQKGGNG